MPNPVDMLKSPPKKSAQMVRLSFIGTAGTRRYELQRSISRDGAYWLSLRLALAINDKVSTRAMLVDGYAIIR